jgi:hypothetical protein
MVPLRSFATSHARRSFAIAAALVLLAAPAVVVGSVPPAQVPDPIVLRGPKSFAAAVAAIEKATGVRAEPFEDAAGPASATGEGRSFALDAKTANRLLAGSHAAFRKAGFYLFRYERGFGLPGEHDHVALLATRDPYAVIRRMRTAEGHGGATTAAVVGWLRQIEREAPFELSEIGVDYLAGRFFRAPKDPHAMAQRTVAIAPALLSGGEREVELLAEEIRANRTLYLIW